MARVKKKAHEKLTKANIRHVIALLNPSDTNVKPITKKEACSILNISYNTTRLQKIIDEYKESEAFIAKRKAQNRGKRATPIEISEVISSYLQGEPISDIAKGLFRSAGFVKGIINRIGIPERATGDDKGKIYPLPDICVCESFRPGQIVWAAKYHAPAVVKRCLLDNKYQEQYESDCYQIYVMEQVDSEGSYFEYVERGGFNAFAPAYDLGNLEHLKEFGVALEGI